MSGFAGGGCTRVSVATITNIVITDSGFNTTVATAINTSSGYIKIIGEGFIGSPTVTIGGVSTASTLAGSSELRVTTPPLSTGSYAVAVTNPGATTSVTTASTLLVSSAPIWTTISYSTLTTFTSLQLLATSDSAITYSLYSGSLPSSVNLSSAGLLTASTSTAVGSYSFVVAVSDAERQTTTATISLSIALPPFVWNTISSIPNALGSAVAVTVNNSGRYVVLGQQYSTTFPYYVTTTDLSTWAAATLYIAASYYVGGVASNSAGLFAVVGYDNYTGVQRADFWYSATGTSWTGPTSYGYGGTYMNAVAYYQPTGTFVAVGYIYSAPYNFGAYLTSANGTSWQNGASPFIYNDGSSQFQPVAIAVNSSGQFVAVGSGLNGPYPVAASYNGSTWTVPAKMNNTTTPGYMMGVAVNSSNLWVAVGYTYGSTPDGQPLYATSTDGTTWTTPANMNGSTVTARMTSVTCTPSGRFVAVGYDSSGASVYSTSSDGSTWTTPARINGSATYFVPKQITTNPVTGDVIVIGNNSGQSALYVTGK
jgi:hypothetical protein